MELPIKAFCLNGNNEKIEFTIDEVFGFPSQTSYEGGYDVKGFLEIRVGCYHVYCNNFYSSTGILYNLLTSLYLCYANLYGVANYKHLLENDLAFSLEMTKFGHATVIGQFQENPSVNNILNFEFETDQTCIKDAINDLKNISSIFGDNTGKH